MSQQIQITGGAKVRDLQDVIIGTSGVLSSLAFDVANGVPKLDSNGKILVSQLPNSVMEYKGTWNAATNTPTLANGTGNQGDVYLCNVAGTVDFGAGPIAFVVGDQVIYSGSIWQRASGATGTVTSVAITESGDSLNITGSPITTSGTINIGFNGTNLQYVNGAGNLTTFPTLITSIGLSMPSAFSVANSPLTANGTIAVTGAGVASQYIRGDGTLANFPTSGGGGSSVAYYFNSSVSQGTLGGVAYRELSKVPIIGAGTDITIATNGYIANYITDAGDPSLLEIPAGNWNFEMFFNASSNGGSPSFYVELYKYDGTTFTLISSSSATPEEITNGTAIDLYTTALAVPLTTLTLTDRLAIRVYVNNSGRTITLHTENSHLCEVITTFSTGIAALNGLTAQVQYFQTGTSGTDFNISSTTATHTFNIPDASATARGLITTGTQTIGGTKTFSDATKNNGGIFLQNASSSSLAGYMNLGGLTNGVKFTSGGGVSNSFTLPSATGYTFTFPNATGTIALTSDISYPVTSVFSRTGAVVATSGDYTTAQVTESGNLYFTDSRARLALSFIAGSGAYNSTTGVITIPTNNNQITNGSNYIILTSLSAGVGISYNNTTGVITNSAPDQVVALTASTGISVTGTYPNFTITNTSPSSGGTVTSVAALTIGTTGTDLSSSVANSTTTPVITLNVPTASATNRGALSSADWTTFNNKYNLPSLTSGSVLFSNGSTIAQDNANFFWDDTNNRLGIGTASPAFLLDVNGAAQFRDDIRFSTTNSSIGYTDAIRFVELGVSTRMTLSSGNLGLGVTPSASSVVQFQIASRAIFTSVSNSTAITNNATQNSGYKYIASAGASLYEMENGGHIFYTAPSGTAGAAITFTQAMTLGSNSGLSIGTATAAAANGLLVAGTVRVNGGELTVYSGASIMYTGVDTGNSYAYIGTNTTSYGLSFQASGERMRIFSTGNISISSSPTDSGYKLDVNGTGRFSDKLTLLRSNDQLLIKTSSTNGSRIAHDSSGLYISNDDTSLDVLRLYGGTSGALRLTIASTGEATFSGDVIRTSSNVGGMNEIAVINTATSGASSSRVRISTAYNGGTTLGDALTQYTDNNNFNWATGSGVTTSRDYVITNYFTLGTNVVLRLAASTGAATFSSSVITGGFVRLPNDVFLQAADTSTGWIEMVKGDSSNNTIIANNKGASIIFKNDASTERMRITSAGNFDYGGINIIAASPSTVYKQAFWGAMSIMWRGAEDAYIDSNHTYTSTGTNIASYTSANGIGRLGLAGGTLEWSSYNGSVTAGTAYALTTRLTIAASGAAQFYSSVTATSFFESSDSRLKTLIQDNYQTKGIESITPKLYTKNGKVELGYYAQDFVGILDSAVVKGSDDMLSLSYREVLVAKVYALEQRIKELENK